MDFEEQLEAARTKLASIEEKGLAAIDEWRAMRTTVLDLERKVAAARDEEHAVPLGGVVAWEPGAPEPRLLLTPGRAVLVYHAAEEGLLGVVELTGVRETHVTPLDEEILEKHPLAGRGLDPGTAQIIECSRRTRVVGGRHHAFWFHDEAIEIIAEGFVSRLSSESP